MPADTDDEVFEVVDNQNKVIGRQLRGLCHSQGLCHRAVYCLVFNSKGELLLQQRSIRKKIGPGLWDLSVAEHLSPGEGYKEAVVRGLREELGIIVSLADIKGPLAPFHLRVLEIPGRIKDCEFVECHRIDGWEGEVQLDADEVQATRWLSIDELYREVEKHPEHFTSWFCGELVMLQSQLQPPCELRKE